MSPSHVAAASWYSALPLMRSTYSSSHSGLGNSGMAFLLSDRWRPSKPRRGAAVPPARRTRSTTVEDGEEADQVERGVRGDRRQEALPPLVDQRQPDPYHEQGGDDQRQDVDHAEQRPGHER